MPICSYNGGKNGANHERCWRQIGGTDRHGLMRLVSVTIPKTGMLGIA